MKRTLSIALAVLTIGLLGSCSKINERLDNLEKKVSGIENEQIASINSQIDGIKTSIADLGTIRSDISSLKQTASDHSVDIFNLEEADRALKDRIVNLEDYVDAVLPNYAEKEWVEATFSTLEQYEATCDTIAKIDARIGALDAKLSKDIKATADSLTKWVNKTFEGYYTAAEMDASLAQMKSDIDSARAANKISDAKADSIAGELAKVKPEVDTVKANIRAEYKAAVKAAIEESEGKLTKELTEAITTVNGKIESLTTRVGNLETSVNDLLGRVKALEGMIQSVTIVPAYSDGSLEDVEGGILTIECIISPASAATSLTKDYFKVLVNTVKTKAVTLDTAKVSDIKIGENGIVSIFAQAPAKPSTGAYAAALRIVQTGANADYTTEFHTFGYSDKNVKVVDLEENGTEYNKVYIAPLEESKGGVIPAEIEAGKKTFDESKPTVIEVRGIGIVTFDKDATKQIAENAAAEKVFFTVEDVTEPGGKQEVVYQVLMKKATDQGEEVFSVDNAAGEVTMEIPLASNVADVTKVTLLDGNGNPISGGVVYGSVIYDSVNKIVTFKVNHFSRYAVGYVLQKDYKPVTGISLDKSALELEKGTFKKLIATITPTDASNRNVIWSSSDTSKVKVDTAGKVTAVALGTATVTATSMNDRSKTATCEVTVVALKPYVEIAAKYNGSTNTTLRWYRQSLAITASGKKAWKDGSGSAVKIPGTDENVVVGDYFPWGTFAGFYGSGAGSDKGLLPYDSFTNKGCGDGSNDFTFKDDKQFKKENTPYWSGSAYTKYNAEDGKTVLEASDDVASIILGGTWRMPTKDDLQAMKDATYWAWDATDKGYYVYAPNPATDAGKVNNGTGTYNKADALLFFPATGYGENTSMTSAGTYGYYRSSTLNSENTEHAYRLYFYYDGVNPNVYTYRYFGFSVRPVQDPAATYKAVSGVTFDVEKKEVVEGGNVQLSATVSPDDATNKGVYWTSSDTTVAKVDALGKVTAVKAGTATITATTVDGTKTATCTVTVKITTFKAVYNTNGGANTLTFYYDANDHSGEGTVYEGTGLLSTETINNPNNWGYHDNRGNIKSVVIDASVAGYKGLTSTAYMFTNMKNANNISGAEYLDVSNVTDMKGMFYYFGSSLQNFNSVPDVSGWKTGKVTSMTSMFSCYGNNSTVLADVPDVSNWNTVSVTDMSNMFMSYGFYSKELNAVPKVGGWNTAEVENMTAMFYCFADSSTVLAVVPDVSNWNTGNVKKMGDMFNDYGRKSTVLNTVPDVSGWNTINVTTMTNMFQNYGYSTTALSTVPNVSNWKTGNVTSMANMFNGYGNTSTNISCVLDLSGWDLSKITSGDDVFKFKPSTFNVTIPAKTGEKSNEGGKWYYGNGNNSIAPPEGKTFTPAAPTPTTTGTAKATIGGSEVDVNWVQLWENGPKFAEYNVGAENSKAEDYGGYYNWGMSDVQTSSNWEDYKSGESPLTGDDDTATKLWGSNWRMPTQTDLQGLIDNCDVAWTTVNDKDGCKFTGKGAYASNSVFLPAAGEYNAGDVDGQGGYGKYWSSTPGGDDYAYNLYFNSGSQNVDNDIRYNGYSVRAVLAE